MGSALAVPKALFTGSLTTAMLTLEAAGSAAFAWTSAEFAMANLGSLLLD